MKARKLTSLVAALAVTATSLGAAMPAQAHDRDDGRYDYRYDNHGRYDRYGHYDRYDRGRPDVAVRYDNDGRYYRGDRYCGRSDGTAGTIIGAIAGGLIGSSAAGRHGDRTAGALIGGGVGALAGRAIDKSGNDCR